MSCNGPKICAGDLRNSISVERRSLGLSAPGSALPTHTYATVFSTRAKIATKQGASEFNKVEIGGEKASHTITIRYTALAFDARDRVRDGAGNLYKILSVENVNERGGWFNLHCARTGDETRGAAT